MRAVAAEHPAIAQYRRDLADQPQLGRRPARGDRRHGRGAGRAAEVPGADTGPGRRAPRRARIPPRPGHWPQLGRRPAPGGRRLAGAMAEFSGGAGAVRALAAEHPAVAEYRRNLAISHTGSATCSRRPATWPGRWPSIGGAGAVPGRGRRASRRHRIPPRAGRQPQSGSATCSPGPEGRRKRCIESTGPRPSTRRWSGQPALAVSRDLASSLSNAGDALRAWAGTEARDRYARAVVLHEALASADLKAAGYRSGLAYGLGWLAWLKLAAGDAGGASGDARRAVDPMRGCRPARAWTGSRWPAPGDARGRRRPRRLWGLGRQGARAGRPGDGRPPQGRRDALPRPGLVPPRAGAGPAPGPRRLPGADARCGLPDRPVRALNTANRRITRFAGPSWGRVLASRDRPRGRLDNPAGERPASGRSDSKLPFGPRYN